MNKEFMGFLKEYSVIGLAIAVIMGGKLNGLVTAVVEGIIMPIIGLVTPGDDWRGLMVGPFAFGSVLGALLDFLIVALLVFWFAKKVLKEDKVSKK